MFKQDSTRSPQDVESSTQKRGLNPESNSHQERRKRLRLMPQDATLSELLREERSGNQAASQNGVRAPYPSFIDLTTEENPVPEIQAHLNESVPQVAFQRSPSERCESVTIDLTMDSPPHSINSAEIREFNDVTDQNRNDDGSNLVMIVNDITDEDCSDEGTEIYSLSSTQSTEPVSPPCEVQYDLTSETEDEEVIRVVNALQNGYSFDFLRYAPEQREPEVVDQPQNVSNRVALVDKQQQTEAILVEPGIPFKFNCCTTFTSPGELEGQKTHGEGYMMLQQPTFGSPIRVPEPQPERVSPIPMIEDGIDYDLSKYDNGRAWVENYQNMRRLENPEPRGHFYAPFVRFHHLMNRSPSPMEWRPRQPRPVLPSLMPEYWPGSPRSDELESNAPNERGEDAFQIATRRFFEGFDNE